MAPLYKTTIVIWSEEDPSGRMELSQLAREAESGDCYCSRMHSERIPDPTTDPDWDDNEFFFWDEDTDEDAGTEAEDASEDAEVEDEDEGD